MKYIFFWTLLLLAATACNGPAAAPKQTLDCYVRYLAPEAQIRAEATLKTGMEGQGAPQPVEVPEGFRYQNVLMSTSHKQGVSYFIEHPGGYTPQHNFRWKDAEGNAHSFDMEMSPVTAFSFGGKTSLARAEPATFTWEGGALEKGEGLVFMWEQPDTRSTIPMEVIGTPGQTEIEFPSVKLSELAPGTWTLYIVRKKLVEGLSGAVQVSGLVEYYSKVDTLELR